LHAPPGDHSPAGKLIDVNAARILFPAAGIVAIPRAFARLRRQYDRGLAAEGPNTASAELSRNVIQVPN
jgi:hypothetical protein